MRALMGGVPRGYKDHRRRVARVYAGIVRAVRARYPTLGPEAMPWLREYGAVVIELEALHEERQAARLSRKERARLRRQGMKLRGQLLGLERHLGTLAQGNGHATDLAARFAEHHQAARRG
jgi:hypothetical protein